MIWVSLGLLAFMMFVVYVNTQADRWGMWHWQSPPRSGILLADHLLAAELLITGLPGPASANALSIATVAALAATLERSGFFVFSNWVVFSTFATFLLPLWSLSFATDALGRDREAGSLIWLLTRPLSRPAIYLAKFLAVLPWSLGFNLCGFALLCWVAGPPGYLALQLYWPAVFWGTLAFCALFQLLGACLARAGILAILYAFFLETLMGNLPGYLKRASISFYTRCLMFDAAHEYGIRPERPLVYLPVSGTTAWLVLATGTVVLLAAGLWLFSRNEYLNLG